MVRLQAMFWTMPGLEKIDPLLTEVVLYTKYRDHPGFAGLRTVEHQLRTLEMTEEAFDELGGSVGGTPGRRALDG